MKRMITAVLVVGALVVASAVPSQARDNDGNRPAGGHVAAPPAVRPAPAVRPGTAARPAFQGHAVAPRPAYVTPHRGFDGHRPYYRGYGGRVFVGASPVIVGPAYAYGYGYGPAYGYAYDPGVAYPQEPVYSAPQQTTYYYCQSAGGYYPDVPACPEPWVPVPAQ